MYVYTSAAYTKSNQHVRATVRKLKVEQEKVDPSETRVLAGSTSSLRIPGSAQYHGCKSRVYPGDTLPLLVLVFSTLEFSVERLHFFAGLGTVRGVLSSQGDPEGCGTTGVCWSQVQWSRWASLLEHDPRFVYK